MAVRKIALMHMKFGYGEGICQDCTNFKRESYRSGRYSKCTIYGDTHSDASDWSGRYEACGMKNKQWNEKPVITLVRGDRKPTEPIPGQISLFRN